MVEHRGDAVKAEAVEVVLRQPIFKVGEKEVEHLVLAVLEALGIPGGMGPPGAGVEKLIGRPVKFVDALPGVFCRVGVDNIQQHGDAQPMAASINALSWSGVPKREEAAKKFVT